LAVVAVVVVAVVVVAVAVVAVAVCRLIRVCAAGVLVVCVWHINKQQVKHRTLPTYLRLPLALPPVAVPVPLPLPVPVPLPLRQNPCVTSVLRAWSPGELNV
jgi:hypothetical protein